MGIVYALVLLSVWGGHLYYAFSYAAVDFFSFWFYAHFLFQGYLFTGLFITAHDSMHGTVSANSFVNNIIGRLCSFLFAGFSYNRLLRNHRLHHAGPCSETDPDYCLKSQNFFYWFGTFIFRYVTITQVITVAVIFNVFKLRFPEKSIWFFYVIPAILGTVQLFFFGTYLPHRTPHTEEMVPHSARTLQKNNFTAMLTCYFFGYHYEHHSSPHIPWWRLYKTKN